MFKNYMSFASKQIGHNRANIQLYPIYFIKNDNDKNKII